LIEDLFAGWIRREIAAGDLLDGGRTPIFASRARLVGEARVVGKLCANKVAAQRVYRGGHEAIARARGSPRRERRDDDRRDEQRLMSRGTWVARAPAERLAAYCGDVCGWSGDCTRDESTTKFGAKAQPEDQEGQVVQ